jgi:hypothetical protein
VSIAVCGARTPDLLQRYAPAHVSRPADNDWQAITTTQRIHSAPQPTQYGSIEYGELPVEQWFLREMPCR